MAALGPTSEQLRSEASEAERLARESGTHAKTAAAIRALQRRLSDFLDAHGDAYGFDVAEGPTVELTASSFRCAHSAFSGTERGRRAAQRLKRTQERRVLVCSALMSRSECSRSRLDRAS